MPVVIRDMRESDIPCLLGILNEIIDEGGSFPFEERMSEDQFRGMLQHERCSMVAADEQTDDPIGMYMMGHIYGGRCDTIANATYLVDEGCRGRGVGEALVRHSLDTAKNMGYRIMQFNGVVDSNIRARKLYEKVGFVEAGVIPKGFRVKDGHYEDMHIMYYVL